MLLEEEEAEALDVVGAIPLDEIKASAPPVARDLARLGEAARILASLAGDDVERGDVLRRFENARDTLHKLKDAVQAGDEDTASLRLRALYDETDAVQQHVVTLDAAVPATLLAERLREADDITGPTLRRLIDYYGVLEPHGNGCRAKLVMATTELVRRERLDAKNPGAVARALRRRGILVDTVGREPSSQLVERAGRLRQFLTVTSAVVSLDQRDHEVRAVRTELLQTTSSISGLAEMIALEHCLAASDSAPTNLELTLDDLELDGARDDAESEAPLDWQDDEDDDAVALLRRGEEEIRAMAADGSHEWKGVHLEPIELDAAADRLAAADLARTVFRAAAARTTIDGLLVSMPRPGASPPEGDPAPGDTQAEMESTVISTETARTLIRHAVHLQEALEDSIGAAIVGCEMEIARSTTRCVHRLQRSRLALAQLASLPPDGGARPDDEAETQRVLERLYREALDADETVIAPLTVKHAIAEAAGDLSVPTQMRARRSLLAAVGLVAVATTGYHLFQAPPVTFESGLTPKQFQGVKIETVETLKGTLMTTASDEWHESSEDNQRRQLEVLWKEAETRGYARVLVFDPTTQQPLAHANGHEHRVVSQAPPSFDP